MAQQNLTPEEKLLRIIETPGGAGVPRGLHARPRANFDWKITLKLLQVKYGALLGRFLTLKSGNMALMWLAGVGTLFLFVDFLAGAPRATALKQLEAAVTGVSLGDLGESDFKPVALYLQDITDRNIFALAAPPPPPAPAPASPPVAAAPAVQTIASNFRVAGILWSANPQAILEDTKKGATILVNRGSTIQEARVKDILKDRVVLSYDGKDIELY